MQPLNIFGFSVDPSSDRKNPLIKGGEIETDTELTAMINRNINTARFDNKLLVDFVFDKKRTNPIRESLMAIAFGDKFNQLTEATALAGKLSCIMDKRSKPSLFLVVNHQHTSKGIVTLWTFPSDVAFRLRFPTTGVNIDVVRDIFSNTSNLRKAALFEGGNSKTDFLGGKVLDFQSISSDAEVAKLWAEKFLQCTLSMSPEAGNRLLARTLKKISQSSNDPNLQIKMTNAAMAIQNSPIKEISFKEILNTFVPEEAHKKFIREIGKNNLDFHFKKDGNILSNHMGITSFQLEKGVIVQTPLSEMGKSVRIEINQDRILRCEGNVISERLKGNNVRQSARS